MTIPHRENLPPVVVHQASVQDSDVAACGGVGKEAFLPTDVTCPACQELNGRPVVHDIHAISAADEPKPVTEAEIAPGDILADRDGDEWVAVSTGRETFLVDPVFLHTTKQAVGEWGPLVKYDFTEGGRGSEAAAALVRLGDAYAESAKTHDLSIDRRNGNVVIAVESETDVHRVYLQEGVARDLGYALAPLTPAQRQLLIHDLMTGGER